MNLIQNLKIRQKLILLLCILLVSLVCVGGIGYYFLSKTNDTVHKMYAEKLIAVELVNGNMSEARKIESDMHAIMLTTNDQEQKELLDDISKRAQKFDENLTKYEKLPLDDETRAPQASRGSQRSEERGGSVSQLWARCGYGC